MSVGFQGTHDIRLESSDDASPTTTVELMLAIDEASKSPRWRELRLPPFPTRQSQGAVGYAHHDPSRDLVFSQNDWADGALKTVYSDDDPKRYAKSTGLDLRWDNVVTLGMKKEARINFGVVNGGAESPTTTAGWTAGTGHTITNITTAPRSGSRHWSVAATGSSGFSYRALANPTVYRSREIKLMAYVRSATAIAGDAVLRIDDGTATADSSAFGNNTTYAFRQTAAITIAAGATFVRVGLVDSAATSTFYIDDIFIMPTGGIGCRGIAETATILYGIFGRCIAQWDEANDVWDVVYINSANAATSIVNFQGNVFVAYGSKSIAGFEYVYGTGTTWTVATGAANDKYAHFFVVSRNLLWRSRAELPSGTIVAHNTLASNSNPVNGGAAWSSEYTVGSNDRAITSLSSFQDSIMVGKEDGLYLYLRVYSDGATADLFLNVTNEWVNFQDSENFSRMKEWHGWMYMTTSQQSFFRYNGAEIQELSSSFQAPRLSGDFGGRIRAMAVDPVQLWLVLDSTAADTADAKNVWLLSLRDKMGRLYVHTMEQVEIGVINHLDVNGGYLWVLGETATNSEPAVYRWVLPSKTAAPAFAAIPSINTSGNFDTSIWDGNLPDEQKAFIALTLFVKPSVLDAEHTIIAKFGVDGAASTTTTLATFSGSGAIQTKYFDTITAPETNAIGRSIQLNFAFATDDNVSPELYAFALHSTLRPDRVKVYEAYVQLGENVMQHNGATDPQSKLAKLNDLLTLENQVYPIRLTADLNASRDTVVASMALGQKAVQIIPGSLERIPIEERDGGVEIWRLLLQEVTVA